MRHTFLGAKNFEKRPKKESFCRKKDKSFVGGGFSGWRPLDPCQHFAWEEEVAGGGKEKGRGLNFTQGRASSAFPPYLYYENSMHAISYFGGTVLVYKVV